ncbi:hypothetical protein EVAR_69737_1 [Eumeta japonica]|uniref:Uncharacterized protein n=1 Tax=Eumeta variegata TaxID=151549 RepID=A0A4C2A2W6_EUMVA|nr:hypothetical protein EVAR_69737_1 [Eumeta japonica]
MITTRAANGLMCFAGMEERVRCGGVWCDEQGSRPGLQTEVRAFCVQRAVHVRNLELRPAGIESMAKVKTESRIKNSLKSATGIGSNCNWKKRSQNFKSGTGFDIKSGTMIRVESATSLVSRTGPGSKSMTE